LPPQSPQEPVDASQPKDAKTITVDLKDGRTGNVEVLAVEAGTAKLRVYGLGGHMVVKRPLDDFTPQSAFDIESAVANATTFEQHFGLAKRAAELGLLRSAGKEARAAITAVEGKPEAEAKTAEVRAWAADALEKQLRQAVTQGDLRGAQQMLKLLATRLADQRTEEQLAQLAAQVEGMRKSAEARRQAERQIKLDEKQRAAIAKKLEPIHARVAAGDELVRKAMTQASQTSAAARACNEAINQYKAAWKATEKLVKDFPDDPEVQREAAELGERLHSSAIDAALLAANMLTVQGDYKGALDWTGKVLAFDPGNAEAKDMMQTIQVSSAAASGEWAWGWRAVR
jgi:hypothetical protein